MPAVTLDEFKQHIEVGSTDAELQRLLDGAISWASGYIGTPLGPSTRTLTVHADGDVLVLPQIRLAGVTSITSPSGRTVPVDPADVNLESGIIRVGYGYERGAWTVVVTSPALVEPDVQLAVMIVAKHLLETQRVSGRGEGRPPGFNSGGATGVAPLAGFAIPNRARELLERYRAPALA